MKKIFIIGLGMLVIWPGVVAADVAIPPGERIIYSGIVGLIPGSAIVVIGIIAAFVLVKIRKQ